MDNLDDWLDSLNMETSENLPSVPAPIPEASAVAAPQPESFSEDDLLDILADNGYSMTPVAEAEEITDEEEQEREEEEEDNTFSYRDATQAAEAQEAIRNALSMTIEEVTDNSDGTITVHTSNGQDVILQSPDPEQEEIVPVSIVDEQADVSVIHEEAPVVTFDDGPLIPPNSPTLLMDESTSRFSGTEWYNEIQKQRIILAGLGGIGSWAAIQLARMNPEEMFLYDDDTVERANMSGQFYSNTQVGAHKTSAVLSAITQYTNMRSVYALPEKFTENTEAGNIMICGFDSMIARKLFFNKWHEHVRGKSVEERKLCFYLDGKMKCLSDNL